MYYTAVVLIILIIALTIIRNVNTYMDPKGTLIFKPFKTQVSEKLLKAFKIHIANSDST